MFTTTKLVPFAAIILIVISLILLFITWKFILRTPDEKESGIPEFLKTKVSSSTEFLDWLKPILEASSFESEYENKDQLEQHVYQILMNKWRLQYVFNTGNAMIINNVPNTCSEIANFLISKGKIKFKKC